jgi:hypothetical protein
MLPPLLTTVLDASVVNGGAIDAFVHALRPEHLLGLLLAGFVCASFKARVTLVLLAITTAGIVFGTVLTAAGVALPLSTAGWVIALVVLAVCALLAGKAPVWLAGITLTAYSILVVNSHAIELQSRGTSYELSFLATFAACAIGLVWMGLALAFMASKSRSGAWVMRAAGVAAALIGVFTLMGNV